MASRNPALTPTAAPPAIELTSLVKRYGAVTAVDGLSLSVPNGELVCLLGPSGCGKTTTLNMVAGFIKPDAGAIHIHGQDMDGVPPYRRNSGMVFQSYALFPHLTVFENVAFGLRAQRAPRATMAARVHAALRLVQLECFAARMPSQLSGGQQQRVSFARALAYDPAVLLLDEPFSGLDARLRVDMRREVADIQRRLGLTTLFVTHDQDEAMSLADRIVVINRGRIEQQGTPEDTYRRPASRFVAGFLGDANFLPVTRDPPPPSGSGAMNVVRGPGGERWTASSAASATATTMLVRPENLILSLNPSPDPAHNTAHGVVAARRFLGSSYVLDIEVCGAIWMLRLPGNGAPVPEPGTSVGLAWTPDAGVLLDD